MTRLAELLWNAALVVAMVVVGSAVLTGVIIGLTYLVWLWIGVHP